MHLKDLFPYLHCIREWQLNKMNGLYNYSPKIKNYKIIFITILSLLLANSKSFSQQQFRYFQYNTYDKSKGLNVDESIYHISTDNKGFLWVSTFNGLFRCSGTLFKDFPVKKNMPGSIPSNNIRFFIQDKKNNYWLNPAFNGIWNYNDTLGYFSKLKLYKDTIGIEKYELSSPFIDDKNYLWVNLQSKGLLKINTSNGHYKFWDLKASKSGNEFSSQSWLNNIYKCKNGYIWLSTNTCLLCLDEKNETIKRYDFILNNKISEQSLGGILEDIDGSLWIGSWSKGLTHFYPNNMIWETYYIKPNKKNNTENITNSILPKNENELWVGSQYGLMIFDKKTKKFYQCADLESKTNDPEVFYSSKNEKIIEGYTLCFDNKKNLITTAFGNKYFNRINLSAHSFKYQLVNPGSVYNKNAFNYSSVLQLPGITQSYLLSSFWGAGIYIYNTNTQQVNALQISSGLPFTNVNELNKQDSLVWICADNGLFVFNLFSKKFQPIPYKSFNAACTGKVITTIAFTKGNIWAGTNYGIIKYDTKNDSVEWLSKEKNQLPDNGISRIYIDHLENIWFTLGGGMGIACYIKQTGNIKRYTDFSQINIGNGEDITESKDGSILFASRGNGVYKISNPLQKNQHIELLSTSNGLTSNRVFTLFTDSDGFTWFCTANGLTIYNPYTYQHYSFYKEDGLMNDILLGRCSEISKGIIALPLKYGFAIINRDSLLLDGSQEISIAIHGFTVNGKAYKDNIQYIRNIQLPYNKNNLSIDFSALVFDNIKSLQYNYRLLGLNTDWANINNRTNLTLYALPPGNYTLQLFPENRYTHAKGTMYQLKISITPPFWNTWWFMTIMILCCLSIVYKVYRFRLERALDLELMRTSISSDLHDEVGATLSSISIFSQTAKQLAKTNPQRSAEILERIGESSRQMVDSMSDIVWNINPANDSFDKMLLRMRSYSTEILEAKEIILEWHQDEKLSGLKLNMEQRKNLYLFFKEAINNIAKYSNAKNAFVQFSYTGSIINLSIEDNGIGYNNEKIKKGNGLNTMQSRVDMLAGKLSIITSENNGVKIHLRFPY